jgi:twitching motility protein PilT
VQHINTTQQRHIVTVENPIEFLHRDLMSSVTQREVGVDTDTYASGLHAALRQDPDVVLIGELADADTVATAVKAAEGGLLVITSVPTPDVTTTVQRLMTMLPPEEREVGRLRLAEALRAIVAQQLLPTRESEGKVAAVELLEVNGSVRAVLRDESRLGELKNLMGAGVDMGMQTFEQHVSQLLDGGHINVETARAATMPLAAYAWPSDG